MKPWSSRLTNRSWKHQGHCVFWTREYRIGVNLIAKRELTFQKFIEKFIRVEFHEWLHLFLYDEGFGCYEEDYPTTHKWMWKVDAMLQRCLFEKCKEGRVLLNGQQLLLPYINLPS